MIVLLSLVGGCADESGDLNSLSECAEIFLPDEVESVYFKQDEIFRGQTSVAVVDMRASDVDAFKSRSGFVQFSPGVPADWKPYWQDTGVVDLLAADAGNEHLVEGYHDPRRWVVIHDSGGDSRRVFIRAAC
ncbi:hypothetical protein AB0H76_06950 [Nocardia sp. NPDC050712]|uniref:hypothetical protein n=1 Tax=Nocardia sp. NPDC050712 TaxID=3155518 RepID=UPI0033DF07C3